MAGVPPHGSHGNGACHGRTRRRNALAFLTRADHPLPYAHFTCMKCYMRLHLVTVKRAFALVVTLTVATALILTGSRGSASAATVPTPPGKLVLGAYASGFTATGSQLAQFERGLGSK